MVGLPGFVDWIVVGVENVVIDGVDDVVDVVTVELVNGKGRDVDEGEAEVEVEVVVVKGGIVCRYRN